MGSLHQNHLPETFTQKCKDWSLSVVRDAKKDKQRQKEFEDIILWLTGAGDDCVYIETLCDIYETEMLICVIRLINKPILITLSTKAKGQLTVSLSSVSLDMQFLVFCMFQV